MLTVTKKIPENDTYFPVFSENLGKDNLAGDNGLLFFDIETTGFSREKNMIYLIGVLSLNRSQGSFRQWMAENSGEETAVLTAFLTYLEEIPRSAPPVLVHFNGNRFDLPFVQHRCSHLGLSCDRLPGLPSYDICQHVKQSKTLLGLENCRQKTVEDFLGLKREDPFNGGELIPIFYRYCKHHRKEDRDALLLHNEEDVRNMPKLSGIFHYIAFFRDKFQFTCCQESDYTGLMGNGKKELYITYEAKKAKLPSPLIQKRADWWISGKERVLTLRLPLEYGEYKYFFPDYQNYYYLPVEDQAIHKSVAAFVDPEFRKKATAKTCYTKATGWFLPTTAEIAKTCPLPLFYSEYGSKQAYLHWENGKNLLCPKKEAEFWEGYLKELLL